MIRQVQKKMPRPKKKFAVFPKRLDKTVVWWEFYTLTDESEGTAYMHKYELSDGTVIHYSGRYEYLDTDMNGCDFGMMVNEKWQTFPPCQF